MCINRFRLFKFSQSDPFPRIAKKQSTEEKQEKDNESFKKIYISLLVSWKCSKSTNEPRHEKTNKMACAPSEDSNHILHPLSLISVRCPH